MYDLYYHESKVGKCKDTTNGCINVYPNRNKYVFLPQPVIAALNLQYMTGCRVIFMCPDKMYHTLLKLYARKLRRKVKPVELVKLCSKINTK